MNKIKSIIVDDESWGIDVLNFHSSKTPNIEILNTFESPKQALEYLKFNEVDLIFLDIQMPEIDGFEFVRLLNNKARVIITTGNESLALKFDKNTILGYLLKPISYDKFLEAIKWYI